MFFGLFSNNFESITVEQLDNEIKKKNNDLIILDVRTEDETLSPLGKIDKSINIPLDKLNKQIDKLEKYRDKEIAVICHSGGRSAVATTNLVKAGFKAKNVNGGMLQYKIYKNNK